MFVTTQLFPGLRHRKSVSNSHFPQNNRMTLYVSGSASRVYHIVLERGGAYTLCGLRVNTLRDFLSEKPKDGVLCKHCKRLQASEPP